jgi:hypothetical protein
VTSVTGWTPETAESRADSETRHQFPTAFPTTHFTGSEMRRLTREAHGWSGWRLALKFLKLNGPPPKRWYGGPFTALEVLDCDVQDGPWAYIPDS